MAKKKESKPINQKIVSLNEIPEGSKIHAITNLSVDGKMSVITFHHLDGMYSYCTVDGHESGKNTLHLSFATPLVKVDDHYEIASDPNNEDGLGEDIDVDADMPPMPKE